MHYVILLILLGMPMITPLAHGIIQNDNTDTKNVMQDESSDTVYTVEGTITDIRFGNLSKTSRVERLAMNLYLKIPDSPHEELKFRRYPLKFRRYPASKADKQLRVGQRVSITARENEFSEYADILHIKPL